ncbi:hypothetical protein [Geothrix mesophila]|uniref:hypothetical protein n=1 Tax=Geothrix mesophila TaxID=2922723 RepID=UPI001FABEFC7|nr:hypothetical protein [Geothrix sp. SG198]
MVKLSKIALTLGSSIALQAMVLIPPPTEIQIPPATSAIQDPVFQKLFGTAKLEGVFQSSLVNVDGFKVAIHISGVEKTLIADLVTKKVALDGRSAEPAATGIRANVSGVEELGGLVMLENPPFEYLQLNQQVIEERASTAAQVEIYRESRLLGNIQNDRMACLRELYSWFYRGWIVRVQLGGWREDYYFFFPRNSNQLLALAAIKVRPVPSESDATLLLNRLQTLYEFRSEGTLVNGFFEGDSRGSIWFQSVGDSDWSRSAAPDPKGIKKLWITPSWSPYVTGLFDLARTKWLDQKRQTLGLPTNQDVIETMLTDLRAQIERPESQASHEADSASRASMNGAFLKASARFLRKRSVIRFRATRYIQAPACLRGVIRFWASTSSKKTSCRMSSTSDSSATHFRMKFFSFPCSRATMAVISRSRSDIQMASRVPSFYS